MGVLRVGSAARVNSVHFDGDMYPYSKLIKFQRLILKNIILEHHY
jgi:hypothetical protein